MKAPSPITPAIVTMAALDPSPHASA